MLTLFTTLALATGSLGALINTNFLLENNEIAPDGFPRAAITTNGQFHGPTIFATRGDDVHVNVINNLDDPNMRRSTSIHWHGLVQKRTNHYDGPAFVSQCPIPPAMSFEYKLHMEHGGTFWYHSHLSSQYLDGLKGAIVVYDPNDPHLDLYDVDDENTVITLSDWWHDYAPIATEEFLSPTNTGGVESVPDSGLINNKGRFVGGPAEPWSVINVEQGKKYRLRVVNTSGIARFRFQIQGHQLTVIEADGVSHEPLVVDFVDVYPGQRYSVILDASQSVDNYWIRAPMNIRSSNTNPTLDVNNVNAILRYAGAAIQDPTTSPATPSGVALVEANMVPVEAGDIGNVVADKVFNLAFTRVTETDSLKFKINGQQYVPPTLPTLLQILNGATANSDFAASENTFVIEKDDIVEINITGAPGHPFHLHGHFFEVVQSATGARNVINPPRRDVVASGGSGITMRFRADNPGPWILHCHIDLHFEAGLAAVFAEAPSETVSGPQSVSPGQDWFGLCPAYQALPAELQ